MKKTLLILFISVISSTTFAWDYLKGPQKQFIDTLSPSERIVDPLSQYFNQQSIQEVQKYSEALFSAHKKQVQKTLELPVFAEQDGCKPQLNVTIGSRLTNSNLSDHKNFESQLIQIESFDCLPEVSINKAFDLFMSDDFMMGANPSLKDSQTSLQDQTTCQQTQVFPIGKSQYCIKAVVWADKNTIIVNTFNEMNNAAMGAPVYWRIVTNIFKIQKNGQIGFYTLTHGRGPDLPFHSIVKKTVANENSRFLSIFKTELAR